MNAPTKCESCESPNIEITHKVSVAQAPYGPPVSFEDDEYYCSSCESSMNYKRVFENSDKNALEMSIKESTEIMLNDLKEMGYSSAYFERAMGLPQRTLSRWKFTNELSSISTALLRTVRTYPWILKVAEEKFDARVANRLVVEAAAKVLFTSVNPEPVHLKTVGYSRFPPTGDGFEITQIWIEGESIPAKPIEDFEPEESPNSLFAPSQTAAEQTRV